MKKITKYKYTCINTKAKIIFNYAHDHRYYRNSGFEVFTILHNRISQFQLFIEIEETNSSL